MQSSTAKDTAWLLFDTALLNSGFQMDDPKEFSTRMLHLMQQCVHDPPPPTPHHPPLLRTRTPAHVPPWVVRAWACARLCACMCLCA